MPDTALYGQFKNLYDINLVHEGLIMLGFQDVYPCAIGAELLSDYYQKHQEEFLSEDLPRINSECPATVRLIAMEFQELIPNVVEKLCSFEVTAILARERGGGENRPPSGGDRHLPDLALPGKEYTGLSSSGAGEAGGGLCTAGQ